MTEAANAGDEGARQCFDTVGRWIGQGLADLAAILDPSCFVVGGGPSDAGPLLMDPAREAFAAALTGGAYRPHPPVLRPSSVVQRVLSAPRIWPAFAEAVRCAIV